MNKYSEMKKWLATEIRKMLVKSFTDNRVARDEAGTSNAERIQWAAPRRLLPRRRRAANILSPFDPAKARS